MCCKTKTTCASYKCQAQGEGPGRHGPWPANRFVRLVQQPLCGHNLQAQPPAPDYSQPTNQPAPTSSSAFSRPLAVLSAKWQVLNLLPKLKFPCITNETDVQVFSVGSWNSNRNNHKLPLQDVLHLQYLQNESDTDSLISVRKGSYTNTYFGITVWNHSIFGTQEWWSSNKCEGLKTK